MFQIVLELYLITVFIFLVALLFKEEMVNHLNKKVLIKVIVIISLTNHGKLLEIYLPQDLTIQ